MLTPTPQGLYCARGRFHVDPSAGVARAIVTHAHGDHARPGSEAYLAAEEGVDLLRLRLGPDAVIETLRWGERRDIDGVTVSLHPAGHMRGAAQVRLEADGDVWVASGDYKRADDPTCRAFEPLRCHTFVSESTFALPVYRWAPTHVVVDDILAWWNGNRAASRASVLFCYALGKTQRVLAELAHRIDTLDDRGDGPHDRTVWIHGALEAPIACYRAAGIRMLPTARVPTGRAGKGMFDGALVIAPPSARGSTWMRRFPRRSEALVSGWMRVRGERRRAAADRGFVISDHADWPALLDTIRETGASRVIATHGFTEALARFVGEQGIDGQSWPALVRGDVREGDGA